ncbi:MAG: hypothetical protein JEZ14_01830 [Marinilabiliaceae bacterium]|nr:hypothetical protein [Marinilabiliaceae bacterium]
MKYVQYYNKFLVVHFLLLSFLFSNAQNKFVDTNYFYGREYFILRSGRAKMVIQQDKADLGPAFSYMLFDAENPKQTIRKSDAYNYSAEQGIYTSALTVKMNNYPFTAMGQTTHTNWVIVDGIPSVEAVWWAGGIRVREVITPVSLNGIFKRQISLEAADLVGEDSVSICLSIPVAGRKINNNGLAYRTKDASIALVMPEDLTQQVDAELKSIEAGPFLIQPGETKISESYLLVDVPMLNDTELAQRLEVLKSTLNEELVKTKNQWSKRNTLTCNDPLVQRSFDVNRNSLPAFVSDGGKMDAGIFEYGAQWVRDASHSTLGLIHIGEFEMARAALEHMLRDMINEHGTTMIASGFDEPDREQFDQMGEFMHTMKSYVDWTGDISLLTKYREKIIAMVERPLSSAFRDETGMVHNRREFWERTFEDAYELAYQTWVIQGLRDGADLARYFDADRKVDVWRKEADIIEDAMLTHPQKKLVNEGHLIKRRNVGGEMVDVVKMKGWVDGSPASTEHFSRLMPDATLALPISLRIVDPRSELAKNTLDVLEGLRNLRWSMGGYERYHSSSQGDQPGPWPFATTFIMRAQHEAGDLENSRRALQWIYDHAGGRTGAIYEEIPLLRTQQKGSGLLPWNSAEISYFMVHHMLGIKFKGDRMFIKPALYPQTSRLNANFRYRKGRIQLESEGSGKLAYAMVEGEKIKADKKGSVILPKDFEGGTIKLVYEK